MSILGYLVPWWGRWAALGVLLVAVAGYSAFEMHEHDNIRYNELQGKFDAYKTASAVAGAQAQQRANAQAQRDKLSKEKADANYESNIAALGADNKRLRAESDSYRYRVPPAPAGTTRPDLACFERSELERGFRDLDEQMAAGARRTADAGAACAVGLNAAKEWAQEP